MDDRYVLSSPGPLLCKRFRLDSAPAMKPRYNIAPGQDVAAIRMTAGDALEAVILRWGLKPPWADGATPARRLAKAHIETVADKPALRAAFRFRRCLIPADGFYVWKTMEVGQQPYYVTGASGDPMALAGIWEPCTDRSSEACWETCAVITRPADDCLGQVCGRMPAIVHPHHYAQWLDPGMRDPDRLASLVRACPGEPLITHPVRLLVNNLENDGKALIEPYVVPDA
jgi:putative SOS response-associated peptidase YedK